MAIAKARGIVLLTGDGALRKAANMENVDIIGSLGILDLLLDGKHITVDDYVYCLREWQKRNGHEVRLPKSEITLRLERL